MTKNQIEYLKYKEAQRSNMANEQITRERDRNTATLGFQNLQELGRHNLILEAKQGESIDETRRHNLATEALSTSSQEISRQELQLKRDTLSEQQRHNLANESAELDRIEQIRRQTDLQSLEVSERARHNVALEGFEQSKIGESVRHNLVSEDINRSTLRLQQGRLEEDSRHNRAQEAELSRHNVATEGLESIRLSEVGRHNRQSESLQSQSIGVSSQQVQLGYAQLSQSARRDAEVRRANVAHESETHRANVAREQEQRRSNVARETEAVRSAKALERSRSTQNREIKRHNYAQEDLERERVTQGWVSSVSSAVDTGRKFIPLLGGILS